MMKRKVEEISTTNDTSNNGDVYSRASTTSKKGRGSLAGWITCPLCNKSSNTKSQKKFSLGRGISMHLQQVHTPWKPGKAELARRERIRRRIKGMVYHIFHDKNSSSHYANSKKDESDGIIYQENIKETPNMSSSNLNDNLNNNIHNNNNNNNNINKIISLQPNNISNKNEPNNLNVKNFPKLKSEETQEEYYQRVLEFELGTVWNRSKQNKNICWTPTEKEIQQWDKAVMELTRQVEREACSNSTDINTEGTDTITTTSTIIDQNSNRDHIDDDRKNVQNSTDIGGKKITKRPRFIEAGHERNGSIAKRYKDSLPPFIKAASEGNLKFVKESLQMCQNTNNNHDNDNNNYEKEEQILKLLNIRDRNGSIAEHWAAGGGHLECLKYLFELRRATTCTRANNGADTSASTSTSFNSEMKMEDKKKRKRDGKTCLHYAARNGHNHIIDYLLLTQEISKDMMTHNTVRKNIISCNSSNDDGNNNNNNNNTLHSYQVNYNIDIVTNDGTTPLHLACYGGHLSTIKHFITKYKADILHVNEWGCGIGHWVAMTVQTNNDQIVQCLDFIRQYVQVAETNNSTSKSKSTTNTNTVEYKEKDSSMDKKTNYHKEKNTTFSLFGLVQKQGHSAVHKAAQKLNLIVIEWLMKEAKDSWTSEQIQEAGRIDVGGNRPSEIWIAMGGAKETATWIQEFGW